MMYSLGATLKRVIQFYGVPVTVQDTDYTVVNGVDTQSSPTTRIERAAVDQGNRQRLVQIFGGSVSEGNVGIYVTSDVTLYFIDQKVASRETRQSFIVDKGYQYRVIAVADWTDQCGVKVYLAERHVVQDQV